MIKRGVIQDLRKVKKGVIEFKIGQQSKKGGHRGNGSLKMGPIDRHMLRVHHDSAPPLDVCLLIQTFPNIHFAYR